MLRSHVFTDRLLVVQDEIYQGYRSVQAWWVINKSSFEQILDTVRNRLLSFALEHEKREGSVIGSTIESPPLTRVISQVFNTYIMGGQNIVGTVTNMTQIE